MTIPYNLPDGQKKALAYIKQHIAENNQSPTYGEIAEALEIATPSARDFCVALKAKGFITFMPHKQRSITLAEAK